MVLLGLVRGHEPLQVLGGSCPLVCGCLGSLLSQGEEGSPGEPIPAQGSQLLLHVFAEQVHPCSVPHLRGGMASGNLLSLSRHEGVQEGHPAATHHRAGPKA